MDSILTFLLLSTSAVCGALSLSISVYSYLTCPRRDERWEKTSLGLMWASVVAGFGYFAVVL